MTTPTPERGAWLLQEMAQLAARPEDLGQTDLDAIRLHFDMDLFAFARAIFGYPDLLPELHGSLAEWINLWGMVETTTGWVYYTQLTRDHVVIDDYRRVMTQIPREHFKTSMGTTANSLWQASRTDPDGVPGVLRPVAIFNEREDNARKWLRAIRSIIQGSVLYRKVYAHLIPPGVVRGDPRALPRYWKWTDQEIDLDGKRVGEVEASISAHGIESATVGGHWPKMIFDDLISVKHKQSQIEMERAREWVRNHPSLMRPAEGSMAYVNCTPWTYSDIYVDLCRDYGYTLYRRHAMESPDGLPDIDNGTPIAPNKFTAKQLQDMHRRDNFVFNSQYMCLPRPGREQSFDPNWVRHFRIVGEGDYQSVEIHEPNYDPTIGRERGETPPPRRVPLAYLDKCLIVDPAPSEPSEQRQDPHARTAILVEGLDAWGRRYILETWAQRASYMDVIHAIFQLAQKWSCSRVHIEEVNFSNTYRHWIRREQGWGGHYKGVALVAYPLSPKKVEKHARIKGREPGWRQGLYYVNQIGCQDFLTELIEYPNGQTIDLLDCMGYDARCLTRPDTPTEAALRHYQEFNGANYSQAYQPSAPERPIENY